MDDNPRPRFDVVNPPISEIAQRERDEELVAFVNAKVPFETIGDYQYLTDQQVVEEPWLMDFMKRFPACFERDEHRQAWLYVPAGDV